MRLARAILCATLVTGLVPVSGLVSVSGLGGVAQARTPAPTSRLPTVAVLDLASAPEHSDLAASLAEAIASELVASNRMTVVERRRLADVLREQAALGAAVVEDETATRLGRVAGASRLVTGRVSRVGSGFQVHVNLVDATDARVLATASASFKTRDAVPLAARELVQTLVGGDATPALDEAKLREASAELARRIGQRFPRARTRIAAIDPSGWATLAGGSSRGLVPGLRMDVYGKDFVTGNREIRGYLLVRQADRDSASGPSKALTEPLRVGDEVVSRPATFRVGGGNAQVVAAVSQALSGVAHFEAVASGEPNVAIEIDITGTVAGSRRLRARIFDREGTLLEELDGMHRF